MVYFFCSDCLKIVDKLENTSFWTFGGASLFTWFPVYYVQEPIQAKLIFLIRYSDSISPVQQKLCTSATNLNSPLLSQSDWLTFKLIYLQVYSSFPTSNLFRLVARYLSLSYITLLLHDLRSWCVDVHLPLLDNLLPSIHRNSTRENLLCVIDELNSTCNTLKYFASVQRRMVSWSLWH